MSSILKFAFIVICFIITLLYNNSINKLDLSLLRLGMFFTVVADLYLIILNYHVVGVALFCIVQIIYIARYDIENFGQIMVLLLVLLIVIISAYTILSKNNFIFEPILPMGLFYAFCLCLSIYKSLRSNAYVRSNKELIIWGMVLFLLCDINVALSYIGVMENLTFSLVWIFYIPSQLFLSISGYRFSVPDGI